MKLDIFRKEVVIASVKVDEDTVYTSQLMGAHKVVVKTIEPSPLQIQKGDYIEFKGERFYINIVPNVKADHLLDYEITFEAARYRLYDKILMDSQGMSDFPYYGTAQDYLDLIISNINQIDPGWVAGTVDVTDPQHMTFDANTSCMVALTNIAQMFTLEWDTENKTIHLVKQVGNTTPLTFKYGRQQGLYSLSRMAIEDKGAVTKVYGYGSTRNIPVDYRGGVGRLVFAERFLSTGATEDVVEATYTDDEIYPRRLGLVTAVSTYDDQSTVFTITDSALNFNLADQIQEGIEGLVSFKTGELAGSDFVITDYNHTTKVITLKQSLDASNNKLPNATYQAAIGDTYVFLDIAMPQSYIDAAELELKEATQEFLNKNISPSVAYALELDPLHAKTQNIDLLSGDRVTIVDTRLGVNELIRVNSISYPVTFPEHLVKDRTFVRAEIADFTTYTTQERLRAETRDIKKEINNVTRENSDIYANLKNAKSTLENVKTKTDFLKTTIDGNVVATGTLIVGDALGNNTAGITGVVDQEGTSVWLWGGAPYASRYTADFRVLKNGMVYATRLKLGYGTVGGVSTGWDVTPSGIISDPEEVGGTNFALIRGSSLNKEFSFGTELNPASSGGTASLTGRIRNARQETSDIFPTTNTALRLEASGANKNVALDIASGGIQVGAEQGMNGILNISVAQGTYPGAVGYPSITITPGDSDNVLFKVVKGIIVGNVGRPT